MLPSYDNETSRMFLHKGVPMSGTVIEKQHLTRREAAQYLGLAEQTLAVWAMSGKHLPFVRMGTRTVRYKLADLKAFVERQTVAAS